MLLVRTAVGVTCALLIVAVPVERPSVRHALSRCRRRHSDPGGKPSPDGRRARYRHWGGLRIQAEALRNSEASFELDNALGPGLYKGLSSAETTLQLSRLVELGGKRQARIAGEARVDAAIWQRRTAHLEVLSETAIPFITVVGAQHRVEIFEEQIASFEPLIALLQKRVREGASSPAETLRAQVAADLFRVERERAKTQLTTARRDLAILMGDPSPPSGRL